jgi:hypothetical protein
LPTGTELTRILQWPGYRVYQHKIDEKKKILELWVRRKRGNRKLECLGCGALGGQPATAGVGRQLGVDEIHMGRRQKFLMVACNLETGEPLWVGRKRRKDTRDEFFREELNARQRRGAGSAPASVSS